MWFSVLSFSNGKEKQALWVLGIVLFVIYLDLNIYKIHDVSLYLDSFNYYRQFSLSQLNQISTYEEPGYVALNILFSKLIPNFRPFYLFYAIVVIAAHLMLIKRYSNEIWFSGMLLLGTYFFPLFLMRQYFAMAICIFSLPFVFKRQAIPFFVCILAAFYFHRSAVVFAVCYFIPLIKVNYKSLLLLLAAGVAAGLSINLFNSLLVSTVSGAELASHYLAYVADDAQNSWKSAAIAVADFGFAVLCYRHHMDKLDTRQSFFFIACGIYAILSFVDVLGTSFTALYRILPYFGLSVIVMLPDAAGYIRSQFVRRVATFLILALYMYSLYSTASPWFHLVY